MKLEHPGASNFYRFGNCRWPKSMNFIKTLFPIYIIYTNPTNSESLAPIRFDARDLLSQQTELEMALGSCGEGNPPCV